jgi:hypothetical protein
MDVVKSIPRRYPDTDRQPGDTLVSIDIVES